MNTINEFDIPPNIKFVLGVTRWFYMPTKDGKLIRAVAVESSEAAKWIAAYTLLLILIFAGIARLVKDVVYGSAPRCHLRWCPNMHTVLPSSPSVETEIDTPCWSDTTTQTIWSRLFCWLRPTVGRSAPP